MENLIFGDIAHTLYNNVKFSKKIKNKDVSRLNAFSVSDILSFRIDTPRSIGIREISLVFWRDGEESREIQFEKSTDISSDDVFSLKLNLTELCAPNDNGLFFYVLKIHVGNLCFYSSSINNFDFYLSQKSKKAFCMLVYTKDYETPAWAGSGTMYHIFVDRFFEGKKKMPLRSDAVRNDDWENGIPEYAPYPGAHLENNEFFGGNLWGVSEKLEYLKELGVTTIYLSPIFEAYSNHKYDTSNYMKVDSMFGGDEAFLALVENAKNTA